MPIKTLDEDVHAEEERLEQEKASLQARYRFTLQRRSMMFQALFTLAHTHIAQAVNPQSSSPSPSSSTPSSPAPPSNPIVDMTIRLSQVSVELDTLAQSLLSVNHQLAQIRQLQDIHAGSALAVALRKLNASFARRTKEITSLKEKLASVEAERDEAWRVAEEMAFEVDEKDDNDGEWEERSGDTVVVNVTDRAVSTPATIQRASRVGGVHLRVPGVGPRVVIPPTAAPSNPDEQIEGEAIAAAPSDGTESPVFTRPRTSSGPDARTPAADGSAPTSFRPRSNSAASRVSAARTRSQRASKASLRIPKDLGGSLRGRRSRAASRSDTKEVLLNSPMDALPKHPPLPSTSSPVSPATSHGHGSFCASPVDGINDVPDVPKLPDADSLARMMPKGLGELPAGLNIPIPPIPVDSSPNDSPSSFLDMITRPNSVAGRSVKEVSQQLSGTSTTGNASGNQNTNGTNGDHNKTDDDHQHQEEVSNDETNEESSHSSPDVAADDQRIVIGL